MIRLDRGGENAAGADPVAAHDHGAARLVLVQDSEAHRLGVLGAALEDVADLDAALGAEGAAVAAWRRVAVLRVADVGHKHGVGVEEVADLATPVEVAHVVVDLVGAGDPGAALGGVGVDDKPCDLDRPGRSR